MLLQQYHRLHRTIRHQSKAPSSRNQIEIPPMFPNNGLTYCKWSRTYNRPFRFAIPPNAHNRKTNTIYILYTLVDCGESVSDCHTLYSTLEKAKAAMEVEIQECMKNFRHGEVKHDFERLYEFMNEDGQGFTVGIDEQIPQ